MTALDLSPEAVTLRLRQASGAADLAADNRLSTKLDLSAAGISHRLREAFELYEFCRTLRALPRQNR